MLGILRDFDFDWPYFEPRGRPRTPTPTARAPMRRWTGTAPSPLSSRSARNWAPWTQSRCTLSCSELHETRLALANFGKFFKFLAGSFSAVSKRIFARKYAFDSIFQALQDLHTFAPLQSQIFSKSQFENSAISVKNQQNFVQMLRNLQNIIK